MTFEEIKEILGENAKQLSENAKQLVALKDRQERLTQEQELTAKQIRQTNKKLGELSNKWGTFTEGMAGESIRKILREKFKITNTSFRVSVSKNGESIELDGFGYANGTENVAVVVEVKSHLRDDAIEQIEETLANFGKFFPDHASKRLYSLVVCVHSQTTLENVLRKKGIHLAVMHDGIFTLNSFKNFTPRDFSK